MISTETPTPEKRRFGCGCLLAMILFVVGFPAATFLVWRVQAERRAREALTQLKATGLPTTAADLRLFYDSPDPAEDTTQLWLDGIAPLAKPEFWVRVKNFPVVGIGGQALPSLEDNWPTEPFVREALDVYRTSLDLFHEAAAKGGSACYPTQFRGPGELSPHTSHLRSGAALLRLQSQILARDGDARGAAAAIHAIFRMVRSLENEPLLGSQQRRWVIHAQAIMAIEDLIAHVDFSDDDLRLFQADLRAPNWRFGLHRALMAQRALNLDAFRNPELIRDELTGPAAFVNNDDLVLYLQFAQQLIDAAEQPWPKAMMDAIQADRQTRLAIQASRGKQLTHLFTMSTLLRAESNFQNIARADAASSTADVAIAVELYRRSQGKLPTKLDDLVPEFLPQVPLDPFDGQPIRFVERDGGYVIYSVGTDGVDDHGEPQQDVMNELPFTVKRRP